MLSSKDALRKLLDGNKRYINQKPIHPNQSLERRKDISKGQNPFAIILCCSDSRVPPEIIFDQGLGDLFVIRVAGNVIDTTVIASIEYAVEHLGVALLMILGHSKCGAVSAATSDHKHKGNIDKLIKVIRPSVNKAKQMHGDIIENAIKINIDEAANEAVKSSHIVSEFIEMGKLEIIKAFYDLDKCEVSIL